MLICNACGFESRNKLLFDHLGRCNPCLDKAATKYITEQEAERKKAPSLKDHILEKIKQAGMSNDEACCVFEIIDMVREHDADDARNAHQMWQEWQTRAEKAEAKLNAIAEALGV